MNRFSCEASHHVSQKISALSLSLSDYPNCQSLIISSVEPLDPEIPGSNFARINRFFPWTRKLINFARWSSSLATLVGPKPHHGSLPSRLKGASQTTQLWKRIYLRGVYTNQETAAHAVVGSIVCAFRRLKKSRRREMSARSYKFHSVCFRIFFLLRA